jgi:hypothetical protein
MIELLSGAIAMASLVIALFFLRFWRDSRDRFFLYFALSFLAQAADRVIATLPVFVGLDDSNPMIYSIRLLAYGLIIWAVLEKNWPRGKQVGKSSPPP